jgi:hypothetical protein
MPDAPTGSSGKDKYDKGSWLVDRRLPRQGPRVIYAHRAKYHELFVFDTETEAWQPGQLGGMPYIGSTGKSKKSKDGGSAASFGDYIYALKGGNTQEFWKYHVELDSWSEADPMPLLGSTGKAKKVKAGADIVGVHDYLFALKGNKTLELWRYTPALYALRPTLYARRGVQSGVMRDASGVMRLSSNPVRAGFVTLRLSGPVAQWSGGPVMVSILDVSGRALQTATCYLQMETSFDLRKLSAGVYLLVLQYDDKTAIQKFVLQR